MIKCLVEDVRAKLRSGVTINSLGQCVEELVLNSIDAKATCIAIRVDLEAFKIQVVDNGSGMGREDLNLMGKRYFTSKCSSVGDLENLTFYGFRGEAVASIANMASIVEVSSKTSRTAKTFVKLFHNGRALEVCEAELSRPSGGTTVTVCNLFHQLPVRRKCMDPMLEFERVRQKVEAVSLMHPSVSLSLRNDISCSMVLQLPKTRDVYSRFCQIYGLGRSQKLREIKHKSGGFEISGYISTEGHYNKNMQFLYVNRRLVLKTRLHKLIDFLLRKESVICKAKSGPASRQASSSPGRHRCGPELYGIFILNVTCAYSDYDVCLEPAKTLIEFQNWDALLNCVEEGVKIFLKRENLFIEPCSEDIREFNEDNDFCLHNAPVLKPSISDEKSIQDSFEKACNEIADSYEMCNLQSKDVKRKSVTAKKSSNLTELNKNLQETEITLNQKIAEPSDPCRNNEVEISLPSKDDTTDFIVSHISEQEPKDTNSSQKASDTHLKPSENLRSSFTGGARSEIRKIDCCGDLQHCAESYIKDVESQQGKAVHKSDKVCILNNDIIQLPSEGEDSNETATETVSGSSLMRLCNAGGGDRETVEVTDDARRGPVSSIPLRLCSTGFITCARQSEPPHECEQTETNLALNMQCRPGPVGAKDIFGNKVNFRIQSLNGKNISSNTNKEYPPPHTREVRMADGNEWLEKKTLSDQVHEEIAMPTATGKRHYETSNVTELPLATSSGIPHYKVTKSPRRQIAVPRSQPSKKLSLSTQLGSLEKFRRCYGRIRCTLPTPLSERSVVGLPILNSQANCDFSKNENSHHGNLSTCETPAVEDTDSNNSSQVFGSLEETLFCIEETSQDKRALCQSPLTLSDYSQVSNKNASCKRSPGSLSSKLSRMKSGGKVEGQLDEQLQIGPSRKDYYFDLESSNNDFLYNTCQTYKSSVEKMGEYSYSISKEGACWQSDSITEFVKGTVSPSPLSNVEGECTVSSSNILSLPAKKDCANIICKDKSTLDESSEKNLKATEVPHMTFLSNLEFSADNTSTGDPRNDLSCSDWLQDFDVSSGKTIYINKATGLSTYSTPPTEQFRAACIQDITTMAVNVVSENGIQFRCHPFRSEIVLPFLPRPRKEKTLASQDLRDAEGESLQSLLSEWHNPVFVPCPEIAVDVTSGQADNLAVKIHNILYPYRFTKDMVHSMQVLQQVDNKFIACLINTRKEMDKKADGNLLILVDQHAAHERIRLEQLIADSYEKEAAACGKKKLLSSSISPPLEIEVTEEQRRFLRCCYKNLEDLGLELSFSETNSSLILVRKVPLCFIEREANELRRKRQPVTKNIVEELIQEQVELVQTTGGGARGPLPLTFLKVLASQACHGAIKFNEHLTLEESCRLIEALSSCQLPFQCAHGRPSMMPLADTDHLQQEKQPKPNLARLRKMARAWHLFGKKTQP
ncbi:DNA mismatch repair protein Mlh3 isoform X1 [Falco rusticolus]|uniref:DNA mismatch repair protein Mlh3 isoform X1 n=1 Tax=Falco rusticolus TaxID=120794 RepID=UPI00188684B8|nr:DNA mismatch repair protein Mlh3 isoform X1 [Falco rusticolus]XP_037249838.1 DNA mismatch repair protein Mlh3 isoform X1 [Falco rusticolus]XP_037249839.1 DNA mismatch repair protein Mlh3 isoform X1 [Falco rusticolus]XP_055571630.1 DNA mismatch repair protein Mlh3 isoform X1 [Falco cherrug]XP_055571631.1 DNA mismatch repair protein Mlh3 isoform X1 [Falco cherrug]XP_055571632.1 DNA mismatch repair protein Mlh3 isoform X1 [Falco cherrug]XP_055571633.1 DNA mismatch repair protein Mlh3 isoform 